MKKIWEHNRLYFLLRPYVDWCTRSSFSSLEVNGKDNVPKDGAVLYAPNHCNTLMDALLVLQADRNATGFGCRADLFSKPAADKALRWLKILPIARERDGRKAIEDTMDTYDEVLETIDKGIPFCIYSEGTHRPKHSLMPFKKGIFRLAVKASRLLDKKVYIVPVGLDYSDYDKAMAPAKVNFGEAIDVTAYLSDHPGLSDPEIYNDLSGELHKRLSKLFVYFPDDENYDRAWAEYQDRIAPRRGKFAIGLRTLAAVLLAPFFLTTAVFASPVWISALALTTRMKDKSWTSTVRYSCKLALLPVLTVIIGVISFIFLRWYEALFILLLIWISPSIFYLIQGFYQSLVTELKSI